MKIASVPLCTPISIERRDGLALDDADGLRDDVPDDEADRAERGGDQADVGEVAADVLALVDEDAEDEYGEHDGRQRPHRAVHAGGEAGVTVAHQHPDRDRHEGWPALPETPIALNHTGYPWDRSPEGLAARRRSMEALAARPRPRQGVRVRTARSPLDRGRQ